MKKIGFVVVIVCLFAVVYFGVRAHMERQVVLSVVKQLSAAEGYSERLLWPSTVFISRPMTCVPGYGNEFNETTLRKYDRANKANSRPLYLASLEGVVPIISKKEMTKLHQAGYKWEAIDRTTFWISRVGFDWLFSNASICIRASEAAHGWGVLIYIKRDGLTWKIAHESKAKW